MPFNSISSIKPTGTVLRSSYTPRRETHAFASIGLLGGSTFSTFSHQTLTLWQAERFAAAGLNVLLNVALGLLAAWLGWRLGRTI
jgi:fluoride ion exporter CrcB/FEX